MASGETPQKRRPDRPDEPVAGTPADDAPVVAEPVAAAPGSEPSTDQATEARSKTAAVSAAASAVTAAFAANVAAKATRASRNKAEATAGPETPKSAKPARGPVTVEGYVRPPGRDIPGLVRASHGENEAETPVPPLTPLPNGAAALAADPEARYKRPVPDVPGIIRAEHEVVEVPPPLFSNEGIVRDSASRLCGRVLGPIFGLFAAIADAGTALGHSLVSHLPGSTMEVETVGVSTVGAESPDFDRYGRPKRTHHRATIVAALVGAVAIVILAMSLTAILPTVNLGPNGSPNASGNNFMGNATLGPNGSGNQGIDIGDNPLGPGGSARPSGSIQWPICGSTPKPTATPTPTPSPSASPSASTSPTPTPSPTPKPTPTPCIPAGGGGGRATATPSSSASTSGSPSPTPGPSASGTPTAAPTPTPQPTTMFAVIRSVTFFNPFYPTAGRTNGMGHFWIQSLPTAMCQLWRNAVAVDGPKHTPPFSIDGDGSPDGDVVMNWGDQWPSTLSDMDVTVYLTCTSSAGPAQSATLTVHWPLLETP